MHGEWKIKDICKGSFEIKLQLTEDNNAQKNSSYLDT
jgi:hypothetical protein